MIRVSKWERPNGFWYVRYWLNGRKIDESARTQKESTAEAYRVRREIEINSGYEPISYADVADLSRRYRDSLPPKTSAKHKHEAERALNTLMRLCGRKRSDGTFRLQTQQITPELLDRFIHRRVSTPLHDGTVKDRLGRRVVRKQTISNVTLRTELRYLSGFFNWCCRQRPRYLRENPIPLSNAAKLKNDAEPHHMITEAEYRALLKACDNLHQYLFIMLGWWTGGRRGELLALHYYHFDFEKATLDMRHFKNNMFTLLPIAPEIIEIVKSLYKSAGESDAIFAADPFVHHGFERICQKAGIRHHRFHDFRISTSTIIKAGGFDASLAALWVGNQATTNRAHYTDLGPVAMRIGSLLQVSDLPPWPSQTV